MKKLILKLIKLLPFLAILQGVFWGKGRFTAVFDLGKIIVTQYDLKNLVILINSDLKLSNGNLVDENDFSLFIDENYQNEYSTLVRDFLGKDNKALSIDLWDRPYYIRYNKKDLSIIIGSSGQDGKIGTQDDIYSKIELEIEGPIPEKFETRKGIKQKDIRPTNETTNNKIESNLINDPEEVENEENIDHQRQQEDNVNNEDQYEESLDQEDPNIDIQQ